MARILLIEDDDFLRQVLAETLEREGHIVTGARDGRQGLVFFSPGAFDLAITDIVMPEKEGLEVVRSLRSRDPHLKVLAISGGGHFGAADTYLLLASRLGAHETLAKPFTRDDLLATLSRLLAPG
jgi:DNA-binding NtrC family response regulator